MSADDGRSLDRRLLVGTYTDLAVLAHTPRSPLLGEGVVQGVLSGDGIVRIEGVVEQVNPAVLVPHPSAPVVYAITEGIAEEGRVERWATTPAGLVRLDGWTSTGRAACALVVAPGEDAAIVVDYWDAVVEVVRLDAQGALGETVQRLHQRRGTGLERQVRDRDDHWHHRQSGPHPHGAYFWRGRVFITDLGADAVFQYRWTDGPARLVLEAVIDCPPGSGPRHMAFDEHRGTAYVLCELSSAVLVGVLLGDDPSSVRPRLRFVQHVPSVPPTDRAPAENFAAEVTLSPDGRFLLVSNRGDDSIVSFPVLPDGRLGPGVRTPSGGAFPRSFALSDDGAHLLVANQDSSALAAFRRDPATGRLRLSGTSEVPSPCDVAFV